MHDPLERALAAISAAEQRASEAQPPLSAQHLADIDRVLSLPENRDGADKSWIWPVYAFCRQHFQNVEIR